MGMKVKVKGSFKNIETYLETHKTSIYTEDQIYQIAEKSLALFKKNTPSKSGKTADSWSYEIVKHNGQYSIVMHNSNIQNGFNIAILVDEGHATQSGTYVSGTHYIDKTVKEVFNYINTLK